ncbi:IS5 family transposase [Fimbriiglobus ruber]|uniref:Mobile element protein n=1 Tax=Fimbriiglobus ruber TaxID=1908690 RepID=A0A225DKW3_9BACT|nr:IS5 family transposase [Fimbriiglobus ruber]OWK38096.1 Mobile element protein [Fimbriiglobus ruber]OWK42142.1 Mobile element protein [Fimbriiglobus ruber]
MTADRESILPTIWEVSDDLWARIEPILAAAWPRRDPRGRHHADWRRCLNGIIYQMRTGCQWNALPKVLGDDSTVHRWYQRWCRLGVMEKIWADLVQTCDDLGQVHWDWQSADGCMGKARHGGDHIGKNPTDRGKNGTKRSIVVDEQGGPLGVVIDGANRHDAKLLKATIEAIVIERPDPKEHEQHLCLDKAYDNPSGQSAASEAQYTPHIRRIGEEKTTVTAKHPDGKPRRWVVERTLSWLNRCRAILVRYAKNGKNYLGLVQLVCSLIWYRRLFRLNGLG